MNKRKKPAFQYFHDSSNHIRALMKQVQDMAQEMDSADDINTKRKLTNSACYLTGCAVREYIDFLKTSASPLGSANENIDTYLLTAYEVCRDMERKINEYEMQSNGIGYWCDVGKLIEDGTANMNPNQIYEAATRILGLFLRAVWLQGEKQP